MKFCINSSKLAIKGETFIYLHREILNLIREIGGKLLLSKETRFIDERLHLIEVSDGENLKIIGHYVTFFDICSKKATQYGFSIKISEEKRLICCGDETYTEKIRKYVEKSDWLLHEAFFLYSEAEIFDPYEKNYSTVKDACEMAEKFGVRKFIYS